MGSSASNGEAVKPLEDSFARNFAYLRLSILDACNFRCVYCLPDGYKKTLGETEALSLDELRRLVVAFAEMGFWKFRVTGGEPTLRSDLLEILHMISAVPGVRKLALSTNGFRLKALAPSLRAAGVHHLNVSIDSLHRERFHRLTGQDKLPDVLAGIDTALGLDFLSIKINAVLLKEAQAEDLDTFLQWVKHTPVSVRFIELMRTGDNAELFAAQHVSSTVLQQRLLAEGWKRKSRVAGDGPAVEFAHSAYQGNIGIIAPYGPEFCSTCNRLRVTSRGLLRLCLFGEGGHSLRPLLQEDKQKEALQAEVRALLGEKKASHALLEGRYGNTKNFAAIGG